MLALYSVCVKKTNLLSVYLVKFTLEVVKSGSLDANDLGGGIKVELAEGVIS